MDTTARSMEAVHNFSNEVNNSVKNRKCQKSYFRKF